MMNWFRENRWLGTFLIVFAAVGLVAIYFLFEAKTSFDQAAAQLNEATAERNRLERLNPFPNEDNFHKMQAHLENYGAAVNKLKDDLKAQVLPPPATLAPNEFQSRLRQAINTTVEKARTNRVRLPDNFNLGFDEYTAALPVSADAAKLLGQELSQIELLVNVLIDARVDGVTSLKRAALAEEKGVVPQPSRKPSDHQNPDMIQRGTVDLDVASSTTALRKVLNQLANSEQQFFIVRTLHVRNDQPKGPSREQSSRPGTSTQAVTTPGSASSTGSGAIKFIVGNEHVEATARIELVRFNL